MGIRTEKKKVIQQIVNNEDSALPLVPETSLPPTDLHWFQAVTPKQNQEEKDKKESESLAKQPGES
jgi:hypothetical protein